jgi:two-component system alkaline phosphatase synthesis response regulator PhoP
MIEVCLVEDEQNLVDLIKLNLEMEGMKVTVYSDGIEAKLHFEHSLRFDLIILDVMLPNYSGFDLCKQIRDVSDVPILFLSAKGTTQDRIKGLKLGANDYLPKPFDLEELLLRIHVLTSKPEVKLNTLTLAEKTIHWDSYEVLNAHGEVIHSFSKKEAALLEFFIQNEGKVVSRNEILDHVWGKDQFPTSRTIDNFVLSFRKLFESNNSKELKHFHSVRGVGYKFTF